MVTFTTKTTKWGITHEKNAIEAYTSEMANHAHFQVNEVGLVISKIYPQFGASPDGIVYCECCEGGCLEVKCPYTLASEHMSLEEFAEKKQSCLGINDNGHLTLDNEHMYYYQVQLQMFCTTLEYCDFVVWSPKCIFIERIPYNQEFIKTHISKALEFHKQVIMPEILGKYYTEKGGTETWCICRGIDDGRAMIQSWNNTCDIQWYHIDCVNLTGIPENVWLCNFCR